MSKLCAQRQQVPSKERATHNSFPNHATHFQTIHLHTHITNPFYTCTPIEMHISTFQCNSFTINAKHTSLILNALRMHIHQQSALVCHCIFCCFFMIFTCFYIIFILHLHQSLCIIKIDHIASHIESFH